MPAFIDLTGKTFGRLTVLERNGCNRSGGVSWRCQCSCGKVIITAGNHIKSGRSKSCGCLKKEIVSKLNFKHGNSRSPEYRSHWNMLNRCNNKDATGYERYGGRGIKVCKRWMKFENFYADMAPRPVGKTIGRIDNNGDYEPTNCRWETRVQQQNNTCANKHILFNGKTLTVSQWARKIGISYSTLQTRLSRNWSVDRAFRQGVMKSAH